MEYMIGLMLFLSFLIGLICGISLINLFFKYSDILEKHRQESVSEKDTSPTIESDKSIPSDIATNLNSQIIDEWLNGGDNNE